MSTLAALRQRYNQCQDQIDNEKLTGDAHTDYQIRRVTYDLCAERNRIAQQAWDDYSFHLKAEREYKAAS